MLNAIYQIWCVGNTKILQGVLTVHSELMLQQMKNVIKGEVRIAATY